MKLHNTKRVHSKAIDSVLVNKNTTETAVYSTLTLRTRDSPTEEPHFPSVYLKDRQLRHREKNDIFLDLDCSSSLSLAEILSAPPQIIDLETTFLESNYQPGYLGNIQEEIKPKILVVENQDESRNFICSILQAENFQVIEAKDSNTAIEKAQKESPELIICELMMPIIDGYGIAHWLRQSKITERIPLLLVTAQFEEANVNSRIILITDRVTIEPLTKAKLLTEISHRLDLAIAR